MSAHTWLARLGQARRHAAAGSTVRCGKCGRRAAAVARVRCGVVHALRMPLPYRGPPLHFNICFCRSTDTAQGAAAAGPGARAAHAEAHSSAARCSMAELQRGAAWPGIALGERDTHGLQVSKRDHFSCQCWQWCQHRSCFEGFCGGNSWVRTGARRNTSTQRPLRLRLACPAASC